MNKSAYGSGRSVSWAGLRDTNATRKQTKTLLSICLGIALFLSPFYKVTAIMTVDRNNCKGEQMNFPKVPCASRSNICNNGVRRCSFYVLLLARRSSSANLYRQSRSKEKQGKTMTSQFPVVSHSTSLTDSRNRHRSAERTRNHRTGFRERGCGGCSSRGAWPVS